MPSYPPRNPFKGARGPQPVRGSMPGAGLATSTGLPPSASPITGLAPEEQTVHCGFTVISAGSAGLTGTTPASYLLGVWTVDDFGQDFALTALRYRLKSGNPQGLDIYNTSGTIAAWSKVAGGLGANYTLGNGAAIIVGKNLPGNLNEWYEGAIDANGVWASYAQDTPTQRSARPFFVEPFPDGDIASAANVRQISNSASFAPGVRRFTAGDRLCVAFALNPDAASLLSPDSEIHGFASISLDIRPVIPNVPQSY